MAAKAEHHVLYQYMLKGARNHYMGLIQTESVRSPCPLLSFLSLSRFCTQPYFQPSPRAPAPFRSDRRFHDPHTHEPMAWALWVEDSHDIVVFGTPRSTDISQLTELNGCAPGAGLYAFFNAYSQGPLDACECQDHLLNIDAKSDIAIYSLSTVGAQWMVSLQGEGVVHQCRNRNGFAATVTSWTR